ncbi:hypothetical protein BBJ28_00020737, partial [Nothophytophthora sp. Chile5]
MREMRRGFLVAGAAICVLFAVFDSPAARWVEATGVADDWYAPTRCNEASSSVACRNYERCKATHRCARGDEDYEIKATELTSYTREFAGGDRMQIALMNDLEDWKSGTHRWRFRQTGDTNNSSSKDSKTPEGWLGWDTFDFPVSGSLELAAGHLVFDTDRAELRGDVQLNGTIATTRLGGTSVAVFNFMTVYLGAGVRVRFQGRRAVALLSRSSLIVDTELHARPGTLGGFPGGGFVGSGSSVPGANNNQNGPGSTSVRVYVKTLSTYAKHVPEVQEIETSAAPGQKLQGHFTLRYPTVESAGLRTEPIAYDASSLDVRRRLETAFPDIGELNVERDDLLEQVPEIGRLWRVTFLSAVGNVPQLQAKSALTGLQSQVVTRTIQDGNQLSGSFQLSFLDAATRWLEYNVTADELRSTMLEDLPYLIDAQVMRTDADGRCLQGSTLPDQTASSSILSSGPPDVEQGLHQASEWLVPEDVLVEASDSTRSYRAKRCRSGRGAAGGFVWKLQFWTQEGNVAPISPTSSATTVVAAPATLEVDYSGLQGLDAAASIVDSQCFSLAFGGSGASFVSSGGTGYGFDTPWAAPAYADEQVTDLLGGSGGAGGGREPIDVFPVVQPTLGGAGAGAILLSAVNDILIGPNATISASGGDGSAAFTAGGGGSGGSVLLVSGATVSHHGVLEAKGGHGGYGFTTDGNGGGGGGSGGRIAIYAQSYSSWGDGSLQVSGGASQDTARGGGRGSVYIKVHTELAVRVDASIGAAGTAKSLLVHGSERYADGSTHLSAKAQQVSRNGPRFELSEPVQPTRISYFVRVGNLELGTLATNRGAIFCVHSGDINLDQDELMLSIALVDGAFTHEANTFQWPRHVFHEKVQTDRWYKLDVTLDWLTHTYSIRLNDVLQVRAAPFRGENVSALSLSNFHPMSTWWDELYVGVDYLRGFVCPWIERVSDAAAADAAGENEGAMVTTKRVWRELWAETYQQPTATTYHPMARHESHLSRQEVYQHDNGGIIPLDGAPHRAFFDDVRELESELSDGSSHEEQQAEELAGNGDEEVISYAELLTIEDLPLDSSIVEPLETGMDWETSVGATSASASSPEPDAPPRPSVYWYSEVFDMETQRGGIGACSTVDYNEWRNEGLVLHFENLTDPFGDRLEDSGGLLADRPKVLFNRATQRFVMWLHVDGAGSSAMNTMGLNGVASSEYPNGPFEFLHSLYPDAAPLEAPGGQSVNETHDQTVAIISSTSSEAVQNAAFLVRTYYKTVEYWLPRPVMDPLWQSVQTPNATEGGETTTDFGLSYHRAFYHPGYDDPTDIYLQRWRMEDAPWEVICCSSTNASDCVSVTQVPAQPEDVCPDGMKKKEILGQAQTQDANATTPSVVLSRYKDPHDDANSAFVPDSSVPAYTPWGFQVLNTKTWRGNYFDALSTNITLFIFKRYAGERRRREIEQDSTIAYTYPNEEELTQNAIPTTDLEILDELLGTLGVPVTQTFKSKYSTYDLAEIDQNSDGKITSFEVARLKEQKTLGRLTDELVDSLLADFDAMKWGQVALLDSNGDGSISFGEFEHWLGADPNLLFDRFDLDKNGYLDENELARSLWYRQMPRLDAAIFLLDPSFDGRVFYERFRLLIQDAPDYIFSSYDFDDSGTLTQFEIDLMVKDLGTAFASPTVLSALKDPAIDSITKATYAEWFSSTTSLVDTARNKLKVDNAVHGTGPDRLIGPLQVVERRRAKYVAISALSDDYLTTRGL